MRPRGGPRRGRRSAHRHPSRPRPLPAQQARRRGDDGGRPPGAPDRGGAGARGATGVPVGRLDLDTEGLLLLTNDGELANRIAHPSHGVDKEYLAQVRGTPSRVALRALREGVELDDGPTAPAQASLTAEGLVKLTIHEGRNRQVRRMLDAVGHPVERLIRTRIGPVADRRLAPGAWRSLTGAELRALERAVADAGRTTSGPDRDAR
ncbi:MAG: pseudouridine synthase [Acidimicrobiales bacterium]